MGGGHAGHALAAKNLLSDLVSGKFFGAYVVKISPRRKKSGGVLGFFFRGVSNFFFALCAKESPTPSGLYVVIVIRS